MAKESTLLRWGAGLWSHLPPQAPSPGVKLVSRNVSGRVDLTPRAFCP